jgi:glucose-6-phosphate 1-epimerase
MDAIDDLARRITASGVGIVRDAAAGGARVEVANTGGTATISLKGAQVLAWTPASGKPVLWTSNVTPADDKAMRGGVPICWPWFADHPNDPSQPFHGLVRTVPWALASAERVTDDLTRLSFTLPDAVNRALPLIAVLDVEVGTKLRLTLTTENRGTAPVRLTEALHTYFRVSDVQAVTVEGLAGVDYLDKVDAFARKHQTGAIDFRGETDRIYLAGGTTRIVDPGFGRAIRVATQGSGATVVWNPGPERGARMTDIHPGGYREFVCVETANAADAAVSVTAGGRHTLVAEITVEPYPRG